MSANTSLEVYESKKFHTYYCVADRSQYRDDAGNYQYYLLFYCFFFSASPYRFLLGVGGIVSLLIGYGFYKFALKYIYDEWGHYR